MGFYSISYYVIPCHAMWLMASNGIACYVMSYHIPYHTIPYRTVPRHTTQNHTIPLATNTCFFTVYKDRDGVIKRLTSRSNQQRQTIAKKFNIRYKQVRSYPAYNVNLVKKTTLSLHFNCSSVTFPGHGEVTEIRIWCKPCWCCRCSYVAT